MSVTLEVVNPEEFSKLGEKIHEVCFKENRPSDFNRFDYSIVCHNDKHGLTAYSTILELDAETAYMQHGGTFPDTPKLLTVKSYMMMVEFLKKKYPVLVTRIFNDNVAMIKLALTAGFKIHGVEYYNETPNFKGGILLNLNMESEYFSEAN